MNGAQARITDFFTLRKRSSIADPPSKRRKISVLGESSKVKQISPLREPPKLPLTPLKSIPSKYKLDLSAAFISKSKKDLFPPSGDGQDTNPKEEPILKKDGGENSQSGPSNGFSSPMKSPCPNKKQRGTPSKAPLSPVEMKKRLGQVRKLSELQARLREISSPEKKVSPVQKELKFTMQLPQYALSPKKSLPPASPSKRVIPAHLRHLNLTTSLLPLPKDYKKLLTVFSAMDQIISLRNNRGECIRLEEILGPVQNVVRSEVSLKHVEQVRCVFPSAFKFTWENKRGRYGNVSDDYELLVAPSDESGTVITSMTPSDLVKRKTVFSNALLNMTKDVHAKFLLSFDPPINIQSEKLARWHKDFNPDTFCPDVDVLRLPAKPEVTMLLTVSEAMRETNKLFHSEEVKPVEEESNKSSEENKDDEDAAFQEALKNRFKGINPALVKKILAKEKIKMEKELVTDKTKVDELRQLDELFDVARFLRSTFINEKKVALRMDFLLPRLLKSFSFSAPEMTKMIKCLSECAPTFLKLINIRNTEYAKLDKNVSLNLVESSINDHKNRK